MRFADEALRHAHADNLRDAYLSAARARYADPALPGMELLVGEMLFNAGHAAAAASHAWVSRERGESSSASSILLGLEAWCRRPADPVGLARASLVSRMWLEQAATANLSDAVPRFFLAEIERRAGRPEPRAFLAALHRLQPWQSSTILGAKMHLAASEAGPSFNAAHFGHGLRLDASPQARAVKSLRVRAFEPVGHWQAKRDMALAFTDRQLLLLGGDPALNGFFRQPERLTCLSPKPRESLEE